MPPNFCKSEVKPLKLLRELIIQSQLSSEKILFPKETLSNSKIPDFHGFNTRATREFEQSTKPKMKLMSDNFPWYQAILSNFWGWNVKNYATNSPRLRQVPHTGKTLLKSIKIYFTVLASKCKAMSCTCAKS